MFGGSCRYALVRSYLRLSHISTLCCIIRILVIMRVLLVLTVCCIFRKLLVYQLGWAHFSLSQTAPHPGRSMGELLSSDPVLDGGCFFGLSVVERFVFTLLDSLFLESCLALDLGQESPVFLAMNTFNAFCESSLASAAVCRGEGSLASS